MITILITAVVSAILCYRFYKWGHKDGSRETRTQCLIEKYEGQIERLKEFIKD